MDRLANVATPLTEATLVVPDSVPPPGLAPMASATVAVELVAVLPNASCTVTCTDGAMDTPATALLGCTENATLEGVAWLMLNPAEVAEVSPAEVAARV